MFVGKNICKVCGNPFVTKFKNNYVCPDCRKKGLRFARGE